MLISGLVLLLSTDPRLHNRVQHALQEAGCFQLGVMSGSRLALVMEVSGPDDAVYWYRWLEKLPDVLAVDIAYVSVNDPVCQEVLQ